jgi:DNA-binding CsgD family transcriptional regulator
MARAPQSGAAAECIGQGSIEPSARPLKDSASGNGVPVTGLSRSPLTTESGPSALTLKDTPPEQLRGSLPTTDRMATPRDVLVALTYGLELVSHGAMLVAAEGHPQLANRTALAILEKKDGISLATTGLVADRAADTRLLHKLLEDAIVKPELGEPKDSPLTLQRKLANSSLIVRVVPGPGLSCWPEGSQRTALLKLYDQDLGLVVDEGALCSLYGLTRGEAALTSRLMQGQSLEEAAATLFISPHTARTHLKRIFMKTDTHRQTELVVRMLLTVL